MGFHPSYGASDRDLHKITAEILELDKSGLQPKEYQGILANQIREKVTAAELRQAMLWLDEYELRFGRDTFAASTEEAMDPLWRIQLSRRGTSLLPPNTQSGSAIPSINSLRNSFKESRAFIVCNAALPPGVDSTRLGREITFYTGNDYNPGFIPTFRVFGSTSPLPEVVEQSALDTHSIKIIPNYLHPWFGNDESTVFLNIVPDNECKTFPYFSIDAQTRLWHTNSTPYLALQLAHYMGFHSVCLLGCGKPKPESELCRLGEPFLTEGECRKAARVFSLAGKRIYATGSDASSTILANLHPDDIFKGINSDTPTDDGHHGLEQVKSWRKQRSAAAASLVKEAGEPLVTVIIPLRDSMPYLGKTVSSIITQTFPRLEILLVGTDQDNGQRDICNSFMARDRRIRMVHSNASEAEASLNTGIREAVSPYIMFIEPDDFLDEVMVEKLQGRALEEGLDIVNCFFCHCTGNGDFIVPNPNQGIDKSPKTAAGNLLSGKYDPMAEGRIYKKELFNSVVFNHNPYRDLTTVYKLYLAANRVGTVTECHYYQRRQTTEIGASGDKLLNIINALGEVKTHIQSEYHHEEDLLRQMRSGVWPRITRAWDEMDIAEADAGTRGEIVRALMNADFYKPEYRIGQNIDARIRVLLGDLLAP